MSDQPSNVSIFPKPFKSTDDAKIETRQDNHNIYLEKIEALSKEVSALRHDPVLNQIERKAVKALIAFVAYNSNVKEGVICNFIQTCFKVPSVDDIRSKDYDDVVRFLVDLDASKIVN